MDDMFEEPVRMVDERCCECGKLAKVAESDYGKGVVCHWCLAEEARLERAERGF